MISSHSHFFFFFFNDTATTEIYTLSLHDALPILPAARREATGRRRLDQIRRPSRNRDETSLPHVLALELRQRREQRLGIRSEEHTSELQSLAYLVCRLLLEKKKKKKQEMYTQATP